MQPQLDGSDYTANTKRGWGALAQSAGVEDFRGVEDLLADRKGVLSPVCKHTSCGSVRG